MRLKASVGLSTQRLVEWLHHESIYDDTFADHPTIDNPVWRGGQRLLDLNIGSYTYKVMMTSLICHQGLALIPPPPASRHDFG